MKRKSHKASRIAAVIVSFVLLVTTLTSPCLAATNAFSMDIDKTVQGIVTAKHWNKNLMELPPNPLAKKKVPTAADSWPITGISDFSATWHNDQQQKFFSDSASMSLSYLWDIPAYFSSGDGSGMVEVAATQIGNIGGGPYKRWYGMNADWCAMFVSWCAYQNGFDSTIIPKTAGAGYMRLAFREMGREIHPAGYQPEPGDIIFFIWPGSGAIYASHVGIVEKADGSRVYTIEGNTGGGSGSVRRKSYSLTDPNIVAYGKPAYPESVAEEDPAA